MGYEMNMDQEDVDKKKDEQEGEVTSDPREMQWTSETMADVQRMVDELENKLDELRDKHEELERKIYTECGDEASRKLAGCNMDLFSLINRLDAIAVSISLDVDELEEAERKRRGWPDLKLFDN